MPRTTNPQTAIRWADPPESATRDGTTDPGQYKELVAALRTRPGDWAIVADVESGSQGYRMRKGIREGKWGFDPAGAFDAVSRTTDGQTRVLACFKAADEAETAVAAEPPAAQ